MEPVKILLLLSELEGSYTHLGYLGFEEDQKVLDGKNFLKLADHFISFANTKNKTIKSTDLNYIMLYAAARYSAHVGKNVLETDNHEDYVKHMSEQFIDMIREHLADPNL